MLIIVAAFVVSFGLAMAATSLLRGSSKATQSRPAVSFVVDSPQLPDAAPWKLTVAMTVLGRPPFATAIGVGVSAPGTTAQIPLAGAGAAGKAEHAASAKLLARLQAAKGGEARTKVVHDFLDTTAAGSGQQADAARAAESARLLGAVMAGCLSDEQVLPATVAPYMQSGGSRPRTGLGLLGSSRFVTIGATQGREFVVRQVGVVGRGRRQFAVAIVARAPRASRQLRTTERVLADVARWIDGVHVSESYDPAC